MNPTITFEDYLNQIRHTPQTVKSYLFSHKIFMKDNPTPEYFKYKNIVDYLNQKRKEYGKSSTPIHLLNSIKKYYDYLIETGKREDHPCRNFFIRNQRNKQVIHHDLFSSSELEQLMEKEERYAVLKQRNQVISSLLIYQGLTSGEIHQLNLNHIDFDKGTLFIRASRKMTQRHIELNNKQFRLFERYIREAREQLKRNEQEAFVLGKAGNRIMIEDINNLVLTFKPLFPDRNLNPQTIRQSVISNWLNEKKIPLEQVQLLAGQKWISTTAKYRQNNMEEQRELMNKWFPLG